MSSFKAGGFWKLGAVGIFSLVLGLGCVKHSAPTVKISSWGDVKQNIILADLIADFEKSHPEIKVELQRVSYADYMTKLLTQFAGGTAPDVIFVSTYDVLNLTLAGVLEPMDEYLKSDPSFPIKDMWPVLLKEYTINDRLWGIPRDVDLQCDVYYNKKAFDEAHLPYPSEKWTWAEFLKDAQALVKKDEKGKVTRWGFVDDWVMTEPWIYSSGGRWTDDPLAPTRYTFNDPVFVRGIQMRSDLIWKYKVTPSPATEKTMGGIGMSELFSNGETAMFLSGLWQAPSFRDIKGFDWDVAMFPKGPAGKRGFFVGGSGYGILSSSKSKKAAWELVKYISGPEGEKKMSASGLIVPALRSVANSPVFLDGQLPLNKKALLKMVSYGVLQTRAKNWREISDGVILPTFDRVWAGTQSAQEAVSQLDEKLKTMPLLVK